MENKNGYSNELLHREKKNQEEKKQKKIVHEMFLLQVAGAITGALIGALLGVVVALSVVLALLKPFFTACKNLKAAGVDVKAVAAGVVGVAALVGVVAGAVVSGGAGSSVVAAVVGVVGGVTGWKAAEEADSVYDAMTKAAKLNCENAIVVVEKIRELVELLAFNNKLEGGKKDN